MLEKDVVLSKIAIIKNCLNRIKKVKVTKLDPQSLDEIDVEDIFVLNLQRAIQASIDMAHVIISQENYALPSSYRMSFQVLQDNRRIDQDISQRLQKMVGFRNIAIHDYQEVDAGILGSILTKRLVDFEEFCRQIHQKLD